MRCRIPRRGRTSGYAHAMSTATTARPDESTAADDGLGRPVAVPPAGRRDRIRSKPGLGQAYRVGAFGAGLACIAVGFALAVLPGPLTIPPVLLGLWIPVDGVCLCGALLRQLQGQGPRRVGACQEAPTQFGSRHARRACPRGRRLLGGWPLPAGRQGPGRHPPVADRLRRHGGQRRFRHASALRHKERCRESLHRTCLQARLSRKSVLSGGVKTISRWARASSRVIVSSRF